MKIYVASSWRNAYYPSVVSALREAGHDVYDFRNPPNGDPGFHWTDVDPRAMEWTPSEYQEGLHHPKAEQFLMHPLPSQPLVAFHGIDGNKGEGDGR